ncbi:MAG: hypothetical protein N3A38_04755 [Planctomycetota bacterium]|nr:hypothetical protein [Planctomycetota bacterium]
MTSPAGKTGNANEGAGENILLAAGGKYGVRIASNRRDLSLAFDLAFGPRLDPDCERLVPGHMRLSIFHALPATVTFVAVELDAADAGRSGGGGAGGSPASASATLSLAADSPLGLPMDESFAQATDAMRKAGRRPCEVFELVLKASDGRSTRELLMSMFRVAWLYASEVAGATDLCIAVMPRHENFYRRVLLFDRPPEVPLCGRHDNAPVVFLSLDLRTARERYLRKYGSEESPRNLYRFFVAGDEAEVVSRLRAAPKGLSVEDLHYFFVERSGILAKATRQQIECLRRFYPGVDFDAIQASARRRIG